MKERVLVLGVGGMLGHKVLQAARGRFDHVLGVMRGRRDGEPWSRVGVLQGSDVLDGADVTQDESLESVLGEFRPTVIVNCVGIVKQRPEASDAIVSIETNSLLPHRLALAAARDRARVIHYSTDCVFTGRRGNYSEEDPPDAVDMYGRSKALGEVFSEGALTLRTSIIGRELTRFDSLLEWFLRQRGGRIRGFTEVWWSGVTTNHLAGLTCDIIERHPDLTGLYQVSSGRISKHDLLGLINDVYGLGITIESDGAERCDRSLRGDKFSHAIGYVAPSLSSMIREMHADTTPYQSPTAPKSNA